MNQKLIQLKHNKQEIPKALMSTNRNRVRSVFADVTNSNFSFLKENPQEKYSQDEKPQIINSKRRNAIIPIPNNHQTLSIDYYAYPIRKRSGKEMNESNSAILTFIKAHQKEILQLEAQIELKSKLMKNVAEQHDFSEEQLEKALDWMIHLMQQFRRTTFETIFQAIELVLQYLQLSFHISFTDLELITCCCIYIASKLVELNPIHIDDLVHQVLENRYSYNDIIKTEKQICQTLSYNLCMMTPLQIVYRILQEIKEVLEEFYESRQISILTNAIIRNLLFMNLAQMFRKTSFCNKAICSMLLTLIDNKVDRRVVRY